MEDQAGYVCMLHGDTCALARSVDDIVGEHSKGPPSDLNGQFFCLYVMGTVPTVMIYMLLIFRAHSPAHQQCVSLMPRPHPSKGRVW